MKFGTKRKSKTVPAPTPVSPSGCACGKMHLRSVGEEQIAPIESIIAASEEAQFSTDEWRDVLKRWISRLTAEANKIGVKRTKDFFQKLDARLEELKRGELAMQMHANSISPRDVEGGIHHGWLRGRYEEAQYRIARADGHIKEIREWDKKEADRKAKKQDTPDTMSGYSLVKGAYFRLTGGESNKYVRLADLRPLIQLPRDYVDRLLLRLQQRGEAVLYPADDPQRYVGQRDAAAKRRADDEAYLTASGERRDIFLLR